MQLTLVGFSLASVLLLSFLNQANTGKREAKIILQQVEVFGDKLGVWLLNVQGLAFLPDGALVLSDKLDYKIKKFDKRGKLISQIGKRGKGKAEFRGPGPIDSYDGTIAVADFASPRIQIFSSDLQYRSTFYAPGPVFDLSFDGNGNLWVGAYTGDRHRLLFKSDESGKILETISLHNSTGDMFDDIFSFVISASGKIVLAYMVQNKIEVWDTRGAFQQEFSVSGLPARPKEKVLSEGFFSKELRVPDGNIFWRVTVDNKGNIFLLAADYTIHPEQDVYVLTSTGKHITRFTLPAPSSYIWIDRGGYLYTIENNRTLVKKYKLKYVGF